MNKPLYIVCSEPCAKYMVSRQVLPCVCFHSGAMGGRVNWGFGSPPNLPNSSKVCPVRGLDFEQEDLHIRSNCNRWRQRRPPHPSWWRHGERDLQLQGGVEDADGEGVLPPTRLATSSSSAQRTTPPARRSWWSRWTLWRLPREQMLG